MKHSLAFLSLLTLTLACSSPALADDDMPMGQKSSTPSDSKMPGMGKMGGMHDMMMPMAKDKSEQPDTGNMPIKPKSQSGGMGCGKDGMNMPMGQAGNGSSQSGSMGMDEHASHHGGGMSNESQDNTMQLPNSSLKDQVQIEQLARQRIEVGSDSITDGILLLSRAKEKNDRKGMHKALMKVQFGIDQCESGLAAQEALDQGVAPRNVAIQWFKKELNLPTETSHGDILGLSWFHFFAMVALVVFAVVMIAMYFLKMRRAAAILNRVAGDEKGSGNSTTKQGDK